MLSVNGTVFEDRPKNRTIEDTTVEVFHGDDLESLKAHVLAFLAAEDFA